MRRRQHDRLPARNMWVIKQFDAYTRFKVIVIQTISFRGLLTSQHVPTPPDERFDSIRKNDKKTQTSPVQSWQLGLLDEIEYGSGIIKYYLHLQNTDMTSGRKSPTSSVEDSGLNDLPVPKRGHLCQEVHERQSRNKKPTSPDPGHRAKAKANPNPNPEQREKKKKAKLYEHKTKGSAVYGVMIYYYRWLRSIYDAQEILLGTRGSVLDWRLSTESTEWKCHGYRGRSGSPSWNQGVKKIRSETPAQQHKSDLSRPKRPRKKIEKKKKEKKGASIIIIIGRAQDSNSKAMLRVQFSASRRTPHRQFHKLIYREHLLYRCTWLSLQQGGKNNNKKTGWMEKQNMQIKKCKAKASSLTMVSWRIAWGYHETSSSRVQLYMNRNKTKDK